MAKSSVLLRLILPFILVIGQVSSFSSGPPEDICDSMKPSHSGLSGQTSAVPYELTVTEPFAEAGTEVTLTLTGKNSEKFKGFMVRAFESGTETAIGSFVVDSNE